MTEITRILWIEEETHETLVERRSYISSNFLKYDLLVVPDLKEALSKILNTELFDIIIVDIRIPSSKISDMAFADGNDKPHYNKHGIEVIKQIYLQSPHLLNKVMIFTNESWKEIEEDFKELDFDLSTNYLHKPHCTTNYEFEEFILKIIEKFKGYDK